MDADAFHRQMVSLDEAGRIRAVARALSLLVDRHNKLAKRVEREEKLILEIAKRVERNRKLTLTTAKAAIKGADLAATVARTAFPRLFRRKRKMAYLSRRYFLPAGLTKIQQEVMEHLFENKWSVAKTARHMRRHRTVIEEHREAAVKRIERFLVSKGLKASDLRLGR